MFFILVKPVAIWTLAQAVGNNIGFLDPWCYSFLNRRHPNTLMATFWPPWTSQTLRQRH